MENRGLKSLINKRIFGNAELCDFFNQYLMTMRARYNDVYPNSTFFDLNNETIFELYQYHNINYFYVHYDKIWMVLRIHFGLETREVSNLIKKMVEDYLNVTDVIPDIYLDEPAHGWLKPFNKKLNGR